MGVRYAVGSISRARAGSFSFSTQILVEMSIEHGPSLQSIVDSISSLVYVSHLLLSPFYFCLTKQLMSQLPGGDVWCLSSDNDARLDESNGCIDLTLGNNIPAQNQLSYLVNATMP
jgi:hypothetical protein